MGIPVDEAEFEDADEVTPDLLEDVVVQATSDDVAQTARDAADGWQLTDIHVDQPTADEVQAKKAGLRRRDQAKDVLLYFL